MGGDTEPQEMFSVLSLWYKESLMHDAIVEYMSIEKERIYTLVMSIAQYVVWLCFVRVASISVHPVLVKLSPS